MGATGRIPDIRRAGDLIDRMSLLTAAIDMAEMLGGECQPHVNAVMQQIDELEGASRPNRPAHLYRNHQSLSELRDSSA